MYRHFRRISASYDDTEDDHTRANVQRFLTGHASLLSDEELDEEQTTALHDAVKASNYEVVEYLVRTDFNVNARDENGRTALDLAEALRKEGRFLKVTTHSQIIALLRQSKPMHHFHKEENSSLPLGWEASDLANSKTVYRQTSVESEIDAITFQLPRSGLLEDRRIALPHRKVQGLGQTYFLDPLRFMRRRRKGAVDMDIASEPHFNEEWYRRDVEAAEEQEARRHSKGMSWYTILVHGSYCAWILYTVAQCLRPKGRCSVFSLSVFLPPPFLLPQLAWFPEFNYVANLLAVTSLLMIFPYALEIILDQPIARIAPGWPILSWL